MPTVDGCEGCPGAPLRSAVAELTWQVASSEEAGSGPYAVVLRFGYRSRAETQMYGVSLPLAELMPVEGADWHALATAQGEVELPLRLFSGRYAVAPGTRSRGLSPVLELLQVAIAATPGRVRVRAAHWDAPRNAVRFTADGVGGDTLSWAVAKTQGDATGQASSTERRLGFVETPSVPLLEALGGEAQVAFDDYVVVFPADSGVAPLYVMLRNRHEFSIAASGQSSSTA